MPIVMGLSIDYNALNVQIQRHQQMMAQLSADNQRLTERPSHNTSVCLALANMININGLQSLPSIMAIEAQPPPSAQNCEFEEECEEELDNWI